jgi:hypothetical protein
LKTATLIVREAHQCIDAPSENGHIDSQSSIIVHRRLKSAEAITWAVRQDEARRDRLVRSAGIDTATPAGPAPIAPPSTEDHRQLARAADTLLRLEWTKTTPASVST